MAPEIDIIFDVETDKLVEDNPRNDYGTEEDERLLGESLELHQQYPVLVRPHATMAGFFIVDGHRRARAARKKGLKSLKAMLVKPGLTEADIRLIQLQIDLLHKPMSEAERYRIVKEIKAANPGLNNKQSAALAKMNETTMSRYSGLDRLIPEAMDAFFAGKLGLKAAAEVSQLKPEDQPALLQVRLGGGTVADMAKEKRRRQVSDTEKEPDNTKKKTCKVTSIPVHLPGSDKLVFKGTALNLARCKDILTTALKLIEKAQADQLSTRSAVAYWRDSSSKTPKEKKTRKPREATNGSPS